MNAANTLLHHSGLDSFLLTIKGIISLMGTLVILIGAIISAFRYCWLRFFPQKMGKKNYYDIDFIRRDLGRTIVLGLEFIIAADVIETTTAPDYYSVGILAIVVIIRTFLSMTLNREINSLSQAEQKKLRS